MKYNQYHCPRCGTWNDIKDEKDPFPSYICSKCKTDCSRLTVHHKKKERDE